MTQCDKHFLAARSSSRTTVVGPLVGPSVGLSVRHIYEKVTFRDQNVIKTYLPTYLWDSSDNCDSRDSRDSSDSSNSSDSSENNDSSDSSDSSYQTTFWLTFCDSNFVTQIFWKKIFD